MVLLETSQIHRKLVEISIRPIKYLRRPKKYIENWYRFSSNKWYFLRRLKYIESLYKFLSEQPGIIEDIENTGKLVWTSPAKKLVEYPFGDILNLFSHVSDRNFYSIAMSETI